MENTVKLPINNIELALALIYSLYKKGDINEVTYQKIIKKYRGN